MRFVIPARRRRYPCEPRPTADHVRFDVIDQGGGIPADDLPQVRRRFVRGRTARGPGNGLGLAIVNRIAADHGGALEITSEVGRGTTATLIHPESGN